MLLISYPHLGTKTISLLNYMKFQKFLFESLLFIIPRSLFFPSYKLFLRQYYCGLNRINLSIEDNFPCDYKIFCGQ